ncbi:MAG: hypothetical protein ABF740_14185, partial [Lacticaseibacillus paracasei]
GFPVLENGHTLKSRRVCASSMLCPTLASPIGAEPTRTTGVQPANTRTNHHPILLIKIINNNYYYL